MKTQFKNPINNLALIFLMLMAMFVLGFGCNTSKTTPDPLAGWKVDLDHDPDQTIVKDYQDYIQKLPSKQKGYTGTMHFFEDGSGQHAISIEIFEGNKNASWQHVLFYDKDDKRIKAIRYGYRRYQS
jgi:hypothetical protein